MTLGEQRVGRLQAAARSRSRRRSRSSGRARSSTARAPAPPTTSRTQAVENAADDQRATSSTSRGRRRTSTRSGLNEDPLALSVAGRNNRYNNVQIDGAVNNDVFGLAASGTPGGTDRSAADQPRRHPGAAAGRLAVRRAPGRLLRRRHQRHHEERHQPTSRAPRYFFGRNQDWVGEAPNGTKIGQFKDQQFGGEPRRADRPEQGVLLRQRRLGRGRTARPASRSIGTGQQFGRGAEIDRFLNILRTRYNYNPGGGTDEFIRTIDSDKFFIRADFNVGRAPPADRAPQLSRRAERHRPADDVALLHAGQLLPDRRTRRTRPSAS